MPTPRRRPGARNAPAAGGTPPDSPNTALSGLHVAGGHPPRRVARDRRLGRGGVRAALVVGALAAIALVASGGSAGHQSAWAVVGHHRGFHATVYGWTSWYGSYDMGPLGVGWCIDHGLRAPDPAFGYVPTPVEGADEGVRRAVAWIASSPPSGPEPVDAAGRMLAIHDLMGAVYPFGRLDVDRLTTANLAGFAGREPAVLARARELKADGLARSHLRGPVQVEVSVEEVQPGAEGRIDVAVTDVDGQAISGVDVHLRVDGVELLGAPDQATIGDGRARWRYVRSGTVADPLPLAVAATADVPSLELRAFASSSVPAQRVALATTESLEDSVELAAPPPPTTVPPTTVPPATSSSTTSTTAPPSTTSSTSTSTTTAPPDTSIPPTTPPTTGPPTTPPTMGPPTTGPPTGPPGPPSAPPPGRGTLPRTGPASAVGLAMTGTGLLMTGTALRLGTRRRRR